MVNMVKLSYYCDLCGKNFLTMEGFESIPYGHGYYSLEIHTDEHKFTEYEVCEECLQKIRNFMKELREGAAGDNVQNYI